MKSRNSFRRAIPLAAAGIAAIASALDVFSFLPSWVAQPSPPLAIAQSASPLTLVRNISHGASVNSVALSSDGRWLATAAGDSRLRVWNVNALLQQDERNYLRAVIDLPASDTYVTSLIFSPDNRWLMTGTFTGDFRRWDLNACDPERPTCANELMQETDYRSVDTNVSFHPGGALVAGSNYDGTITLWNWGDASVRAVLEPETGAHDGSRLDGRFSSLSFTADGRYLTAGTHNQSITFWDLEDEFERVLTIETTYGIEAVDLSPDNAILASGDLQGVELRSVDYTRRGPEVSEPLVLENPSRIRALTFSPDGRYVVSGDADGTLAVWDVEVEQAIARSGSDQSHGDSILEVVYNPATGFYATAGADGVVKLWRLQ